MLKEQSVQERQYHFPYHHVPKYRSGFSTAFFVRYGLKYAASLEWIIKQIAAQPFRSLCDVGCGDGRLVAELTQDFPDREIIGIDYSERSINLARGMAPEANFEQTNILEEEVGRQFDIVTLVEVFEHIPVADCEDFVHALAKLSPKGGYLLVTVPHENLPLSEKHFQHFTVDKLRSYFEPYYDLEKTQFLEKSGGWRLYLSYRLLKNKLFILNNRFLLNRIYCGYARHLLLADSESECERLCFLLRRK